MLSPEELAWLNSALGEIDGLLRGMADFRQFPDLLNRNDARLETLLEHVVTSVRDARLVTARVRTRIEDAQTAADEEERQTAEAARKNAPGANEEP